MNRRFLLKYVGATVAAICVFTTPIYAIAQPVPSSTAPGAPPPPPAALTTLPEGFKTFVRPGKAYGFLIKVPERTYYSLSVNTKEAFLPFNASISERNSFIRFRRHETDIQPTVPYKFIQVTKLTKEAIILERGYYYLLIDNNNTTEINIHVTLIPTSNL